MVHKIPNNKITVNQVSLRAEVAIKPDNCYPLDLSHNFLFPVYMFCKIDDYVVRQMFVSSAGHKSGYGILG